MHRSPRRTALGSGGVGLPVRHRCLEPRLRQESGGPRWIEVEPDLAADNEPEEQDQCRILSRKAALGLHPAPKLLVQPLNIVVLNVFQWLFGNWKKLSSSSPPSWMLRITPGQRALQPSLSRPVRIQSTATPSVAASRWRMPARGRWSPRSEARP
jgi:hypothetical protein